MSDTSPGDDRLELERFLPYRLSVLANGVSRRLAGLYADRFGLTIPEWRVMAVLGCHPGISADAVRERTGMDKVAVSRAVSRLRDRGFVLRRTSSTDRRRSELSLSAAGARCYRRIVPLARAFEARLVESLSAADLAGLNTLIDRLSQALADIPTDGGA